VKIKWIGLACFLIVSDKGVRIVIDPFEPHFYGRDYGSIDEKADIVTASHYHADHSYTSIIKGNPKVFAQVGTFHSKNIVIQGIKSYHDDKQGWERGDNIIFCFDIDDMRVCHFGDLGHLPDDNQLAEMGHVDVLFFPVGGRSTLDPDSAKIVIDQIKPSIAIPMHFNTGRLTLPCKTADVLAAWPDLEIIDGPETEISKEQLPEPTTIILPKEAL
jgi:L-ascorbate metabolism protein UlaG (beta-lactamase superfamily)